MREEAKEIDKHIRTIVTDLSNLVLLINFIKKEGCDDMLDSLMNMILKEINKAKYLMDVLNNLQLQNNDYGDGLDEDVLEVTTINCDNTIGWPIKELSMWIWCAWKLKCGSVIFLQNTNFTHVPGLWTLFGVSIDCFGSESSCGVSVLFPLDFSGRVESNYEFKDGANADSNWNGRCVIANIVYKSEQFSLVNMLAPTEKTDRGLFLRQATKFIKQKATTRERLICGTNFAEKVPSMTLTVPEKVSSNAPLSTVMKFIPCQPVAQYLSNTMFQGRRGRNTSPAEIYVSDICSVLNITLPGIINWFHCCEPTLTDDNYRDQMKVFLELGMVDLWTRKNSGLLEFSTASHVGSRTVTMTQMVHFYVQEHLYDIIKNCSFDHIPRMLGITNHAALSFRC